MYFHINKLNDCTSHSVVTKSLLHALEMADRNAMPVIAWTEISQKTETLQGSFLSQRPIRQECLRQLTQAVIV
jgi:hypothetical protein